jgi:hypothetical protein
MSKGPTVLLVPPTPDHPLLAPGRAGAMAPLAAFDEVAGKSRPCPVCGAAVRWYRPPTDQMDPCYICSVDWQHQFEQEAVIVREWRVGYCRDRQARKALVLALDGKPVPEGMDRAARTLAALDREPEDGPMTFAHARLAYIRVSGANVLALTVTSHTEHGDAVYKHYSPVKHGLSEDVTLPVALATIAAHRLGCEVVVVGEGVRDA